MVPELPAVMLACARIGAVFSVVFAGFSAESLAGRISDSFVIYVTNLHLSSVGKLVKG
jgi:acyl-coenzyme A synthetase/AMP-(fatty) acid ligase